LNLLHVDTVIVLVGPNPLDPDNALFKICRHDQPVVIAFDIENNLVSADNVRSCIKALSAVLLQSALLTSANHASSAAFNAG
jgi:hypothetical protein